MKTIGLIISLCSIISSVQSETKIEFTLKVQSYAIKYFEPLDGFSNRDIAIEIMPDDLGKITINPRIEQPTFIKFILGETVLWLLVEPNDNISVDKIPKLKDEPLDGVFISGNNANAHIYYNKYYNYAPYDKFLGIHEIFDRVEFNSDTIIAKIANEFLRQEKWVDSLYSMHYLSEQYAEYMKTEIESTLAWEVGNLCDLHMKQKAHRNEALNIKHKLFTLVSPLNKQMYTSGLGMAYYYTYFEGIYEQSKSEIDTSKIIIPELPFYALAPLELQKRLWGQSLFNYLHFVPTQYDYCKLFKKYKSIFKTGDYVDQLEKMDFCAPKATNLGFKIIGKQDVDLFSLISLYFPKKRVFIDLWATWCAPCKKEFTSYDSSFYSLMAAEKISLFYISIDKLSDITRWEKEIKALNLIGTHAIVDKTLLASIKDIIYNGQLLVIPRYILVNEEGKMISDDFKRPSEPTFKEEIVKLLR